MSERMVSVPESLIEDAATNLDRAGYHGTAERLRDALILQPTPTTGECCDHPEPYTTNVLGVERCRNCGAVTGSPTAQPSITDMAPGTTFTAVLAGSPSSARHRFSVESVKNLHHRTIDPSTIRDVTPPS